MTWHLESEPCYIYTIALDVGSVSLPPHVSSSRLKSAGLDKRGHAAQDCGKNATPPECGLSACEYIPN